MFFFFFLFFFLFFFFFFFFFFFIFFWFFFVFFFFFFFFFFQAEDGIRDRDVTGVQTCALPIWKPRQALRRAHRSDRSRGDHPRQHRLFAHRRAPALGALARGDGLVDAQDRKSVV